MTSRLPLAAAAVATLLLGAPCLSAAATPTYAVTSRLAGPDGGWDLAAVDAAGQRLYVARSAAVTAVDLRTGAVTGALAPLVGGHGVLPILGSRLVLATNGKADTAILFDGVTGAIKATLPVGRKPDAIAWDPATRTAWVMDAGAGALSVIDPEAAKVVATVAVGGSLELGAADGAGRLYVNVEDRNEVAVIDTRARKLVTRFPLGGCEGPTGLAYDARDRQILSACANGVAKVSGVDGRAVASLPIGPKPDGAVYDAARGVALVPSGGSGALAVIRLGAEPAVVQTLPTMRGARTIALDPSTGRAYIPSAQFGPPPAGGGRGPMTPGTFAVLVVAPSERPVTSMQKEALSKAPPAILMFWVVKICATTVGETGGDAVSMTLKLGYLAATLIFLGAFAVTLVLQVSARRYHPVIYWLVVVATTTVGTTTSDFIDRTLHLGYVLSSAMLFGLVLVVLAAWRLTTGAIRSDHITSRRDEIFYWLTILVSNTLGTALGDFTADDTGLNLGFETGAVIFAALIAVVALAHWRRWAPQAVTFWAAYVLTRPLGATLGDTLTKPHAQGGLEFGRILATAVIAVAMVVLVALTPRLRRPAS